MRPKTGLRASAAALSAGIALLVASLRADYTRSSADHVNINTDSSWFYFTVVQ
jgi:hypothetical protein